MLTGLSIASPLGAMTNRLRFALPLALILIPWMSMAAKAGHHREGFARLYQPSSNEASQGLLVGAEKATKAEAVVSKTTHVAAPPPSPVNLEPGTEAPIVDVAEAQALVPRVCALVYDSGLNPSYDLGETTTSAGCLGAIEDDPGRESGDREHGGRRRPTVVDVGALVSQALDRAIALAPAPGLEVAPSGIGLTGLPSYFWLDRVPQPISATASAGGIVVTAQAHPTSYVWDFGDGNDLTTTHAGRAWTRWREGNIEHLYETRGRYDIGVEVVWSASWSLNGGPPQSLGNFSTSDSRRYPVQEVVARLVPFR